VKKNISVFFLSIYLLSTTQLSELLKLPLLIQHFTEHQKETKDISFLIFLKMHYFNGDPKDADYDKDMKLPFKTTHVNTSISTYIAFESQSFQLKRQIYTELKIRVFTIFDSWYSNSYLNAIWQPPKSC
jgi:hypothetical protein